MAIKVGGTTVIDNDRNINVGIITANEYVGSGDKLIFSPTITSFSPVDDGTDVSAYNTPNITITFDQPVANGVGKTATLRKNSFDGEIVQSHEIGVSTSVTISGQNLSLNAGNLDYEQEYYWVLPDGFVVNYVAGPSGVLTTYNFTTENNPVATGFNPGIGQSQVGLTTNFVITFDKNVRAGLGTIAIRLNSSTGSLVTSFDVNTSDRLTFNSNTLTIDPVDDLNYNGTYYVVIPEDAVAGYTGIDTYFVDAENQPLTVQEFSPAPGATGLTKTTVEQGISLTFDYPPLRGFGTITLRSGSAGGTIIESFDAEFSPQIGISSNTWTLTPTDPLLYSQKTIFPVIPSTAIDGYEGANIGGGTTSYSFTTEFFLGSFYAGGYVICQSGGTRWLVAPSSAQVTRSWYCRNDATTVAQQVSGCTGWFVPNCNQLKNPGSVCLTYWDSYNPTRYWSSTAHNSFSILACAVHVIYGNGNIVGKNQGLPVRAFRTVSY